MQHLIDSATRSILLTVADMDPAPAPRLGEEVVWLPDDDPRTLPSTEEVIPPGGDADVPHDYVETRRFPEIGYDEAVRIVSATIDDLYIAALAQISSHPNVLEVATWKPKKERADIVLSGPGTAGYDEAVTWLASMVSQAEADANGLSTDDEKARYKAYAIVAKATVYDLAVAYAENARSEAFALLAATGPDPHDVLRYGHTVVVTAPARLDEFLATL